MRLNKQLELGIKIIQTLAKTNKRLLNKEINQLVRSDNKGQAFIEQITLKLKRAKLILTKSGKRGGMLLNKDKTISVYDIAKALNEVTDNVGSDSCTKFRNDMLTLLKNNIIIHKEEQVNQYDLIDSIFTVDDISF